MFTFDNKLDNHLFRSFLILIFIVALSTIVVSPVAAQEQQNNNSTSQELTRQEFREKLYVLDENTYIAKIEWGTETSKVYIVTNYTHTVTISGSSSVPVGGGRVQTQTRRISPGVNVIRVGTKPLQGTNVQLISIDNYIIPHRKGIGAILSLPALLSNLRIMIIATILWSVCAALFYLIRSRQKRAIESLARDYIIDKVDTQKIAKENTLEARIWRNRRILAIISSVGIAALAYYQLIPRWAVFSLLPAIYAIPIGYFVTLMADHRYNLVPDDRVEVFEISAPDEHLDLKRIPQEVWEERESAEGGAYTPDDGAFWYCRFADWNSNEETLTVKGPWPHAPTDKEMYQEFEKLKRTEDILMDSAKEGKRLESSLSLIKEAIESDYWSSMAEARREIMDADPDVVLDNLRKHVWTEERTDEIGELDDEGEDDDEGGPEAADDSGGSESEGGRTERIKQQWSEM